MIQLSETLDISAPPEVVWGVLSDPEQVVKLLPGSSLDSRNEDGSYDATLSVKFGPAKVSMKARLTLELDSTALSGRVISKGKDSQGGVRFETQMYFDVKEKADGANSLVDIRSDVTLTGKLANVIESGATLVSKRMATEFSERLTLLLEAPVNTLDVTDSLLNNTGGCAVEPCKKMRPIKVLMGFLRNFFKRLSGTK